MNPTNSIPHEAVAYIRTALDRGEAEQSIRQQFAIQGWPPPLVETAFKQAVVSMRRPVTFGRLRAYKPSDVVLQGIFRGGFAFIFLINGVIAWVRPSDFTHLLATFPPASALGIIPQLVIFIGINDSILGLLILSGKWQKYVIAWAGIWLSIVTLVKLVSLL